MINNEMQTGYKPLGELIGDITTQDIRAMLDELREKVLVANDYTTLSKLIEQYQDIAEGLLEEVGIAHMISVEELITQEEKELEDLTIRHNKIVEYQNANPSFYHDDEELSNLLDEIEEKLDFIVSLKNKLK